MIYTKLVQQQHQTGPNRVEVEMVEQLLFDMTKCPYCECWYSEDEVSHIDYCLYKNTPFSDRFLTANVS